MTKKTTTEVLEWAKTNVVEAETLCDKAATARSDDGGSCLPELTAAEKDLESQLLSCLECRPGGLDPKTPQRNREWLWRGLGSFTPPA